MLYGSKHNNSDTKPHSVVSINIIDEGVWDVKVRESFFAITGPVRSKSR